MRLWRLAREPYLRLDGLGPERNGGRWTSPGRPVVNFASEPGLAVLVVLRYLPRDLGSIEQDYFLGWTETAHDPEDIEFVEDPQAKRLRGDEWLKSRRSLLARVQSAVLPEASVIMMNPRHPDASGIPSLTVRPFSFEECLTLPPLPN